MKAPGYMTFGEIADASAKKRYPKLWRPYRDDYMEILLHDYWTGRIETVFALHWILSGIIEPFTRNYTWNSLSGTGDLPHKFRDLPERSKPAWGALSHPAWDELAAMNFHHFSSKARENILEELCLSEEDARDWIANNLTQRGLTADARSRGGSRSRQLPWLKEAIQRIVDMLEKDGTPPTLTAIWSWLRENAPLDQPYEFDPPILGCDYLYVDGDELSFEDQAGNRRTRKRRSLERYMPRPSAH